MECEGGPIEIQELSLSLNDIHTQACRAVLCFRNLPGSIRHRLPKAQPKQGSLRRQIIFYDHKKKRFKKLFGDATGATLFPKPPPCTIFSTTSMSPTETWRSEWRLRGCLHITKRFLCTARLVFAGYAAGTRAIVGAYISRVDVVALSEPSVSLGLGTLRWQYNARAIPSYPTIFSSIELYKNVNLLQFQEFSVNICISH
ncbi:hypothetical protein B0H11DRAFT_406528 [Mycena galericulata]|nr:hypothetical protein B0H11DRAFT_406528 [Mycena galericulata]